MGQYILCKAVAAHPYYVRELGIRLYTAEELCYYIYHNIALIEEGFIGSKLLTFLREEVQLPELADKIERYYRSPSDLDNVLAMILRDVAYYSDIEVIQFQDRLARLRKQNRLERGKEKGDQLFAQQRYERAIREYSDIITCKRDLRLKPYFYAQVLQHMGAAYMQLGLCDEALECLEAAYQESPEPFILKQMFFLAMETGRPYPKELEQVDAVQLTQWQQNFLEVQNRHLAAIQTDESQMIYYEEAEEREKAIDRYLSEEKRQYRMMVMG